MYAVMIYQTLVVVATAFTHANINLPKGVDKLISYVFVSPNMHKVHHHWKQPYTDSNYGATFSIWDRMFGTFKKLDTKGSIVLSHKDPKLDTKEIRYGLDRYYPAEKDEDFIRLLKDPFLPNKDHK